MKSHFENIIPPLRFQQKLAIEYKFRGKNYLFSMEINWSLLNTFALLANSYSLSSSSTFKSTTQFGWWFLFLHCYVLDHQLKSIWSQVWIYNVGRFTSFVSYVVQTQQNRLNSLHYNNFEFHFGESITLDNFVRSHNFSMGKFGIFRDLYGQYRYSPWFFRSKLHFSGIFSIKTQYFTKTSITLKTSWTKSLFCQIWDEVTSSRVIFN